VDIARALAGLDPETTLVVIVSKTFTTAETMLNARTLKRWLIDGLSSNAHDSEKHAESEIIQKHMVAVR
jgi:glucose-6-phosphate isomerase